MRINRQYGTQHNIKNPQAVKVQQIKRQTLFREVSYCGISLLRKNVVQKAAGFFIFLVILHTDNCQRESVDF